jgi:FkbM family methyltransferase
MSIFVYRFLLLFLILGRVLCDDTCTLLQASTSTSKFQTWIHDASEAWDPLEELPGELREIGIKLFSSMDGVDFDDFVKGTDRPRKVDFGREQSIVLVRQRHDNSWKDLHLDTVRDDYDILKNPDIDDGIILDIGSNIGTQAIMAAKFHHRSQVIAMEPLPTTYFYLLWNMHLNGVRALDESEISKDGPSGILALNTAATWDGRTVRISIPNGYDSEQVAVNLLQKRRIHVDVQSTTLPSLLSKYQIHTIKLFKIDCEGCEHEVLPSIADRYICDRKRFQRIEGELHWANTQTREETTDVLRACGCPIDKRDKFAAKGDNAMFSCGADLS